MVKELKDMTHEEIKEAVKKRYSEVAFNPGGEFNFPVGREFALSVGYPREILDKLPKSFYESFTGAGSPLSFVDFKEGETLLDLGCGTGLDLYFYAKKAGELEKIFGIDISEEMIEKAKENMKRVGIKNVEIICCHADDIPLEDNSMDIVTSNGIYNLSPDKETVLKEVYRILKPGGRVLLSSGWLAPYHAEPKDYWRFSHEGYEELCLKSKN
jgi:SAM-dependent methyltransferase